MSQLEMATLGGGCFWCLEAVYEQLQGVSKVVSGYAGGSVPDPSYEHVCAGTTGHAEVVQVSFDANDISFGEVLEVFFSIHDPTTLNRQGGDSGTQYRSAIFFDSAEQETVARATIVRLTAEKIYADPFVTEIVPLEVFYPAEDYHQGYFRNNPGAGYCTVVVAPKVAKFRKKFAHRLQAAEA
jgi:peptide-methionine (S)-S-oxide reductase